MLYFLGRNVGNDVVAEIKQNEEYTNTHRIFRLQLDPQYPTILLLQQYQDEVDGSGSWENVTEAGNSQPICFHVDEDDQDIAEKVGRRYAEHDYSVVRYYSSEKSSVDIEIKLDQRDSLREDPVYDHNGSRYNKEKSSPCASLRCFSLKGLEKFLFISSFPTIAYGAASIISPCTSILATAAIGQAVLIVGMVALALAVIVGLVALHQEGRLLEHFCPSQGL